MRTCPQQVRTAPLQGVLPALQAKLSLRCGKSRQRQMHLFLNFIHYVQTVWDKTLLSHCRVIYLSRNTLQQVQRVFEVRVLSLPGPTGTRLRDGYLFKDFFIQKYRLQQVQPAWVGEGTAAVGSQVVYGFYQNRQRQQFIPCIRI